MDVKREPLYIQSKSKGFAAGESRVLPPVKPPSVLGGSTTLREALYRDAVTVATGLKEPGVRPGEELDPVLRSHLNGS